MSSNKTPFDGKSGNWRREALRACFSDSDCWEELEVVEVLGTLPLAASETPVVGSGFDVGGCEDVEGLSEAWVEGEVLSGWP